jgi:hypothetical protein
MFRLDLGSSPGRYCDGLNRRSFLQLGVAGMAAVGLPQLLRAKEASKDTTRNTSVILIWLDGGPGHMDMYDMKPDAPAEYRGIWRPIRTKVPGFDVTELYPMQARVTDKFSVVRSLHHDTGDHFAGGHRMLTTKDMGVAGSNNAQKFPGIGAIVNRELGARVKGMPGYTATPHAASIGLVPGYFGGHMIGKQHDPFVTGDPSVPNFQVPNLNLAAGLTMEKLEDRKGLLKHFDSSRGHLDAHPTAQAMDKFAHEAYEFVTGPNARQAFDIGKEDSKLRDRYGRHLWGQSCLLARRLTEAGAAVVVVDALAPVAGQPLYFSWDDHANAQPGWDMAKGMRWRAQYMDQALTALIEDIYDRGLDERTLVVACGEFGRTPRVATANNCIGRDHYPDAMCAVLSGGGLRTGQVVGSTTARGEHPKDRPLTPQDLLATVYRHLGIDHKHEFKDRGGRPIPILNDGDPIRELV